MIQEKFTAIETTLDSLTKDNIVRIWNEYCEDTNRYDDRVEDMDCFDELMDGSKPSWIADRIFYGDFNPRHDYFGFNGYGNLISWTFLDDEHCPINIGEW